MSESSTASLLALTPEGSGVRVDFERVGDRYRHALSLVNHNQSQVVWQCLSTDELGPLFQELHQQSDGNGNSMFFLSGAGGGAHWSMSLHREGEQAICFDMAARIAHAPVERTIEYVCESSVPSAIELVADISETVVKKTLTGITINQSSSSSQSSSGAMALPITLRWRYTLRST